MIDSDNFITR